MAEGILLGILTATLIGAVVWRFVPTGFERQKPSEDDDNHG